MKSYGGALATGAIVMEAASQVEGGKSVGSAVANAMGQAGASEGLTVVGAALGSEGGPPGMFVGGTAAALAGDKSGFNKWVGDNTEAIWNDLVN